MRDPTSLSAAINASDGHRSSPPSLYEQTAQKAMLGPDARRLWDQAASGRGPLSRLALDAPFQEKAAS